MTTAANQPGMYTPGNSVPNAQYAGEAAPRRLTTETKASFKTTEFFAYLAAVVCVLIASQLVGTEDGHGDYFRADRAWLYITILTVGYMISRGLAKSGSRERYDSR
jgi:hypothetical protein